jgi:hypothetical protein
MTDLFRRFVLVASVVAGSASVVLPRTSHADDAPIASAEQGNGKVRADILSLKRGEGDTVTLRFAVINDSDQPVSMTLANMKLLDLVNRRSYGAGATSPECRTEPGERSLCWAVFAAPGASTKAVSIQFYEKFDLISAPITG